LRSSKDSALRLEQKSPRVADGSRGLFFGAGYLLGW
jgi:hypothetical protein